MIARRASIELRGVTQLMPSGEASAAVLKDVDLSLYPGELTVLTGPSGSGKTTLLSILGCLRKPTRGSVAVMGETLDRAKPEALAAVRRAHIGFVFQDYNLFPTLTAQENLRLALDARERRGPDAAKSVADALAAMGLTDQATSRPAKMSGGQQQRLAIARAIVGGAAIVLADEPTSALDADNGRIVMELLAGLALRSDAAVMVVTHDPRVERHADRLVRIEDGKIIADVRQSADERLSVSGAAI